jgi:hypothetical protein
MDRRKSGGRICNACIVIACHSPLAGLLCNNHWTQFNICAEEWPADI